MVQNNISEGSTIVGKSIIPSEWNIMKMCEVSEKITDGTHDTPKTVVYGIPYITAIHVKDGYIDFKNCYYVSEEDHRKIYERCNPTYGDIAIVNIGAGTASFLLLGAYNLSLGSFIYYDLQANNNAIKGIPFPK